MKTCLRGRERGIPSAPQTADTTLHNTRSEIHGYNNTDKDKKKRVTVKVRGDNNRIRYLRTLLVDLLKESLLAMYSTVLYL